MTPDRTALLRESWITMLEPRADACAATFYDRLFETAPAARAMFPAGDLREQRAKFLAMMSRIVRTLDEPQRLVPTLSSLGSRHVGYGASAEAYGLVGETLLDTFAELLGDRFTPELRDAWREGYALIAGVMQRGAARTTGEVMAGAG